MKYDTYSQYDSAHTGLAESAFLTVWASLSQWHNSLVLVGGMVPKYLCGDISGVRTLPRPATLDVDFGIALAADSGQYGNLFWELGGQGFHPNPDHPFLALKLRAFRDRQQPKDAFDILYTVLHYDGGLETAVAAFAEEVSVGNPACADALRSLDEHFVNETSPGPAKASHFVLGDILPGESSDTRYLRTSIRQDMVDVATRLRKATIH